MKNVKQLICLLVLTSVINEINAQKVQELGSKLINMKGSSDVMIKTEADQLNSLVYDSKPTLYGQNGQLIRTGEQVPVRLITDVSSMPLLNNSNPLYNGIEFICIKVENPGELNTVLKLSDLSGFVKLKYICFQSSFQLCSDQSGKCEIEKISNMIRCCLRERQ